MLTYNTSSYYIIVGLRSSKCFANHSLTGTSFVVLKAESYSLACKMYCRKILKSGNYFFVIIFKVLEID